IEIEGDAAFLSRDGDGLNGTVELTAITEAAVAMHSAFHAERQLVELNLCPCASCTQTAGLKLKFVAHVGEVATQQIKRHRKLVGMDVIYVHRLLKSQVPVPEYVLLSEDLYTNGATDQPMQEISQDLDGIGEVRTYFVEVDSLPGPRVPVPKPSLGRRFGATVGMLGWGVQSKFRRAT